MINILGISRDFLSSVMYIAIKSFGFTRGDLLSVRNRTTGADGSRAKNIKHRDTKKASNGLIDVA